MSLDKLSRREFMTRCALCGAGVAMTPLMCSEAEAARRRRGQRYLKPSLREAAFWESMNDGKVRCLICPNRCERGEGEVTACNTRINKGGKLYTTTYGRPCVVFEDALEKNPLYHVAPGQSALGVGTAGCNLRCTYCQNWEFSQVGPDKTRNMELSPEDLIARVKDRGLKWVTFSYTEPVAYYEYALATAKRAQQHNVKVAMVTAAYIEKEPLKELMKYTDAFSVTLKGYNNEFYKKVVGCELKDVWNMISLLARSSKWLELVTLIVPTLNDDYKGLRALARSVTKLDRGIPLHFLRFSPAYKLKHLPPTPRETLEKAREISMDEGLKYVYLANLPGHDGANTYCEACGKLLIERVGFKVLRNNITSGKCPQCRKILPGVNL